jgi:TRAP-type C4-dicarboxylate transport system permease small subunit
MPIAVLAAAYAAAMLILWTGWQWFLPNADTPFGNQTTGLANGYFQVGRALYYTAPLFIGWGISVLAARQRISPWWPASGLVLIAWLGATARVSVHRPSGAIGQVGMTLATQNLLSSLLSALVIFSVIAVPWVAWRVAGAFLASESSIGDSASSR